MLFLEGRVRRALVFELKHEIVCAQMGKCTCNEKVVHVLELNRHTGDKRMVEKRVKVPKTITVFFKKRSRIDEPVLSLPAVQKAINARPRQVRIVRT